MTSHPELDALSPCEFCEEFAGRSRRAEIGARLGSRSRLRRLGSAIAFPTVSPLVEGHVLISPIRHVCSIRQSTRDEQSDVLKLARESASAVEGKIAAVFEHGVGASGSPGCGIVHAHLHCIPLPRKVVEAVADELASCLPGLGRGTFASVYSVIEDGLSYVAFGQLSQLHLFSGERASSQLVRQLIAAHLEVTWDWRDFTRWDEFDSTLKTLQDVAAPL